METVKEFRQNFDKTYYNKVVNLLNPFENERKTALLKCILFSLLILIVFGFTVYLAINIQIIFPSISNKTAGDIICIPIGIGILLLAVPGIIAKNFENKVKDKVMPIILRNLNGLRWSEHSAIKDTYIKNSRLATDFNRRYDDDSFQGNYKNVKIDICETELGEKTGSGRSSSYTVRFKGVLVRLIPERQYKGMTLIKKQELLNFTPDGLEQVHLEDVIFEKQFNVYSDDQIEARYVLTTAFMERFKNIKLAFRASKIEASISQYGILIGISTNRDLFKVAKIHRPIHDYEAFKQMADEFASILELIDELKLYQNIGL